jgi:AraC-like DNA-binding protein/mannose-6-phosphate isomerase-like protein (cupin superfamily)
MTLKETKNLEHGIHIENLHLRIQFAANMVQIPVASRSDSDPWGLLNLHTHPYTELFFCEAGSLEIKTKTDIISLLPYDILLIPAHIEHIRIPPAENVRGGSMRFSCFKRKTRGSQDVFGIFNRHLTKREPLIIRQRPDLTARIRTVLNSTEANTEPVFIAASMADILMQLMESLNRTAPVPVKDSLSEHTDVDIDSISRLELLIAYHYMKDLSTADAAKHFHISARQLDRIAYRRYGMTFRQAVVNHRLHVAVEMFSATQMTIEEIGLAVGFSSRLSFSRAFSAKHGMSPQQYRKRFC